MTEVAASSPIPTDPDVLVVGAGAGGAAVSWRLSGRGANVLLIDAGPAFDMSDYKVDANDWELQGFPGKPGSRGRHMFGDGQTFDTRWDCLRKVSKARGLYPNRRYRELGVYNHIRGIGGTTLHFTGWAHRFHRDNFRLKTLSGEGFDWPIAYDDLETYYCEVEAMLGVAGPVSVTGRPMSRQFPTREHKFSALSRVLAEGARSLGLSWTPNPVAAPSSAYRGRPPCNYCGCCAMGCPRGDKGSADITFVAAARETGRCLIRPLHTLVKLERDQNDKVAQAVVSDANGNLTALRPRHVVLAAGAIETPRILLAMDGLANESGKVGQRLMETHWSFQTGLHPDPIGSHRGYPEDSICWDFDNPNAIQNVPGGGIILPLAASERFVGPAAYAHRLIEGFGTEHKRRMRDMFGHAVGVQVICENLPTRGRFVELADDAIDATGMPLAKINSVLTDTDLQRLCYLTQKAEAILAASGVPEVIERASSYEKFVSTHLGGTCMMGDDPEKFVVNSSGRSHRWKNLWFADASVLPTLGSGVGPSVTIQALAVRTADILLQAMGNGE